MEVTFITASSLRELGMRMSSSWCKVTKHMYLQITHQFTRPRKEFGRQTRFVTENAQVSLSISCKCCIYTHIMLVRWHH